MNITKPPEGFLVGGGKWVLLRHSCRLYLLLPFFLQKDPGFDRGQFHKQIAVMRGQVSLGHPPGVIHRVSLRGSYAHVE